MKYTRTNRFRLSFLHLYKLILIPHVAPFCSKWEPRPLQLAALSCPPSNQSRRILPPLLRRRTRRWTTTLIRTSSALFACRSSRTPFSLPVAIAFAICVSSLIFRTRVIAPAALISSLLITSTLISSSTRFVLFYFCHFLHNQLIIYLFQVESYWSILDSCNFLILVLILIYV